jgi:hypothetical protein
MFTSSTFASGLLDEALDRRTFYTVQRDQDTMLSNAAIDRR